MSYKDYLQSCHWQEILERDSNTCVECGCTSDLHVHHISYDNRGNETGNDLETLCKNCHRDRHCEELILTSRNKFFTKLFRLPEFSINTYTGYFCSLLPFLEKNTNRLVGRKKSDNGMVNIPLSNKHLTGILGISRTSFYRFMKECKYNSYIVIKNGNYYISPIYAMNGQGVSVELYLCFKGVEELEDALTDSEREKIRAYLLDNPEDDIGGNN